MLLPGTFRRIAALTVVYATSEPEEALAAGRAHTALTVSDGTSSRSSAPTAETLPQPPF